MLNNNFVICCLEKSLRSRTYSWGFGLGFCIDFGMLMSWLRYFVNPSELGSFSISNHFFLKVVVALVSASALRSH